MNKKETKFTFGFEIEGVFYKSIFEKKEGFKYDVKSDGSIREEDIVSDHRSRIDIDQLQDGGHATEIAVGVFDDLETCINHLSKFENDRTYFNDERCGLHLHIKPVNEEGRDVFWDLPLIKELEKFAFSKLCTCVKARKNNRFCENYSEYFDDFYYDYQDEVKYKFVRNHPSGTMEFRFFSPCVHKEKNVELFINHLVTLLEAQVPSKSAEIELDVKSESINFDLEFSLYPQEKTTRLKHRIDEIPMIYDPPF